MDLRLLVRHVLHQVGLVHAHFCERLVLLKVSQEHPCGLLSLLQLLSFLSRNRFQCFDRLFWRLLHLRAGRLKLDELVAVQLFDVNALTIIVCRYAGWDLAHFPLILGEHIFQAFRRRILKACHQFLRSQLGLSFLFDHNLCQLFSLILLVLYRPLVHVAFHPITPLVQNVQRQLVLVNLVKHRFHHFPVSTAALSLFTRVDLELLYFMLSPGDRLRRVRALIAPIDSALSL